MSEYTNKQPPVAMWPLMLLSPMKVLHKFKDLSAFEAFIRSAERPLGPEPFDCLLLIGAVVGNTTDKLHTQGWRIFDNANPECRDIIWICPVNEPSSAIPVFGAPDVFRDWFCTTYNIPEITTKKPRANFKQFIEGRYPDGRGHKPYLGWEVCSCTGWPNLPHPIPAYEDRVPDKMALLDRLPLDSPYLAHTADPFAPPPPWPPPPPPPPPPAAAAPAPHHPSLPPCLSCIALSHTTLDVR